MARMLEVAGPSVAAQLGRPMQPMPVPISPEVRTAALTEQLLAEQRVVAAGVKTLANVAVAEARKTRWILAVAILTLAATTVGLVIAALH